MSESENKDAGAPPKKTPDDNGPPSLRSSLFRRILIRIRSLPKFLQEKTIALLQWFSGVLEEAGGWKKVLFVLAIRVVRAIARWVAGTKPLYFVCLLGVLLIAILCVVMLLNSDEKKCDQTSKSIILCFSAMGAKNEPNDSNIFRSNDTGEAIQEITDCFFDIFDARISEPNEIDPDDNSIVINVLVGCYESEESESTATKLKIRIPELKICEEWKIYTRLSRNLVGEVARKIKESVLAEYPPVGKVIELRPPNKERLSEPSPSQPRIAILNIGRLNGVRRDDIFELVDPNRAGLFSSARTIRIWDVSPLRSTAHVPWEQEIKVGWCVKWKKSGQ
jgi:hypothetical protein